MSKVNSEPCIIEDNHIESDDIIEERLSFDAIKKMCIELGYYNRGIHVKQANPLEMCYAEIPTVIYGTKHNIIIADDISLKVKENHPHGWYRKFEKKRF